MRSVSTKRRALLLALLIILTITPVSAEDGAPPSTTLDARIKPPIGAQAMEPEPDPSLFDMFMLWLQMNVLSPFG
jgi:hypothetical protein